MKPERIGRYEPTRELARDVVSITYEARDPLLGRAVRVRCFVPPSAPEECASSRTRFLAQTEAAARLFHRSLPAVLDSGEEGEAPYAVFEAPQGQSLREVLELGGPPRLADILEIARQLFSALAYLHGSGVAHADVLASNVYVTATGQVTLVGAHTPLPEDGADRARLVRADVRQAALATCGLLLGITEPSMGDIQRLSPDCGVPPRLARALSDAALAPECEPAGAATELLRLLQDPAILDPEPPRSQANGATASDGSRLSRAVLGVGLSLALACALSQVALLGAPAVAATLGSLALGERARGAVASLVALIALAVALVGGAG